MYARDPMGETGKQCLNMCVQTLTKMANGGIHDHIGQASISKEFFQKILFEMKKISIFLKIVLQGFARYSVDGKWHVPHFEKMLYDQGQLLRSYAEAYLASKDPLFAEITNDIVTYLARELRHPVRYYLFTRNSMKNIQVSN